MTRADLIPATETAAHIAALITSGWKRKDIAARVGITGWQVGNLRDGHTRYTHPATAAAILALEPLEPFDPTYSDWVVVERLVKGADWRDLPPHPLNWRLERLAALDRMPRGRDTERSLGLRLGPSRSGFSSRERVAS